MRCLFLAVVLLAPLGALAEDWQVRYPVNDRWVVDHFRRAPDGWQDFVSTQSFSSTQFQAADVPNNSGKELRGQSGGVLWEATEKWSEEWEQKYSEWVAAETDIHFFQKYQIRTDCADVLYSLRWIFARINKLEMANRLAATGDWLTHRSLREEWKKLPTAEQWHQDKRFLAALNYLLRNTITHELMKDSYPVKINFAGLAAGGYHLELHGTSGHTQVIYRTQDKFQELVLPFMIYQSTTPRQVRELMLDGFWTFVLPVQGSNGLLRMRWPDFSGTKVDLVTEEKMPHFSLEQFDPTFVRVGAQGFFEEVYKRLNPNIQIGKVVTEGYRSLQALYKARLQIVQEGSEYCAKNPCPPGSSGYDGWSTPSRDQKIFDLYQQLVMIQRRMGGITPEIEQIMSENFLELDGVVYNLNLLSLLWKAGTYSSDPRELPQVRWGISGASAGQWVEKVLLEEGAEREKILRSRDVPAEIDEKFQLLAGVARNYCFSAPESECPILKSKLSSALLTLAGESLSLNQWIERIPWMVGAVKETKDRQWGRHSTEFSWLAMDTNPRHEYTASGWMLSLGKTSWYLARQSNKGAVIVQQGSTGLTTLLSSDTFLKVENGVLLVSHLANGSHYQVGLNFEVTKILPLGKAFALLNESTLQFQVGFARENEIQWIDQGFADWFPSDYYQSTKNDFNAFMYGHPGGTQIWDFNFDVPTSIHLKSITRTRIFANNNRWIGISGVGLVMKSNGAFVESPVDSLRVLICHASGNHCLILNRTGNGHYYEFVSVTDQGDFKNEMYLTKKGYLQIYPGYLLDWSALPEKNTAYRWSETGLERVNLQSDESIVWGIFGQLILSKKTDGTYRFRRGDKEIFSEKAMMNVLNSSDSEKKYFETYDREKRQVSLRTFSEPRRIISSGAEPNPENKIWETPTSGALTTSGLWIH